MRKAPINKRTKEFKWIIHRTILYPQRRKELKRLNQEGFATKTVNISFKYN